MVMKFMLDSNLHVTFCDVGQGDAILIWRRGVEILIDTGPPHSVQACLWKYIPFWDRTLEKVVITHADRDHSGNLQSLVNTFKIDQIITNEYSSFDNGIAEIIRMAKKKKTEVIFIEAGDHFSFLGGIFEVLWPEKRFMEGEEGINNKSIDDSAKNSVLASSKEADNNPHSVVLRLKFGGLSGLFFGDIGAPEEKQLITSGELQPVTFFKVAHHGSRFSTSPELLEKIQAKFAVISVGKNSFGHPSPDVMKRLQEHQVTMYRTDISGDIELISDGKMFKVRE